MDVFGKLKEMLGKGEFANDGSRELAEQWLRDLHNEKEMHSLLVNKGFKLILDHMKRDFVARVQELVMEDPELKAIKRMFVRTVGQKGTEERITKYIEQYLEDPVSSE